MDTELHVSLICPFYRKGDCREGQCPSRRSPSHRISYLISRFFIYRAYQDTLSRFTRQRRLFAPDIPYRKKISSRRNLNAARAKQCDWLFRESHPIRSPEIPVRHDENLQGQRIHHWLWTCGQEDEGHACEIMFNFAVTPSRLRNVIA